MTTTTSKGAPKRGCRAAAPPPPNKPAKPKLKKKFVDIMISDVLCDFPFSQDQPLKSADDWYRRILKNKLIKLKKQQGRTL
jgi:hypothetical protein